MTTANLDFDELNIIDFEEYFGAMNLTAGQKKHRVEFAEGFYNAVLIYFERYGRGGTDEELIEYLIAAYIELASGYADIDEYLTALIDDTAQELHSATLTHEKTPYYTSPARAANIAANESNKALNYAEYADAASSGKVKKTWLTMLDEKVRATHVPLDGKTISINEVFIVGGSMMRFPLDTLYGAAASEIINCRCTIKYS